MNNLLILVFEKPVLYKIISYLGHSLLHDNTTHVVHLYFISSYDNMLFDINFCRNVTSIEVIAMFVGACQGKK